MDDTFSLGVDLGGTKTEAALLRRFKGHDRFEVVARERVPTPREDGYEAVLHTTANLARTILASHRLDISTVPVGVGMPGAVTRRHGLVKNSNTTCLNGRHFRGDLSRLLGRDVLFENDANCFALAEARLGAAREYHQGVVFGAILGTGVGGGLILHGRPWPGPQNLAGEWGHHAVGPWRRWYEPELAASGQDVGGGISARGPCYCGKTGCLELYLSGRGAEREYTRRSREQRSLRDIVERKDRDEHAEVVVDELLEGFVLAETSRT